MSMGAEAYIPRTVQAGETLWISSANTAQSSHDIILTNYTPAGGYTLAFQFASATPISVAAVANGDNSGWTLEVTAVQTLAWKPGRLQFAAYVTQTSTGRVFAVGSGSIAVSASPLATSTWTAVVTACDAAIANYAASPTGSLSIDGMSKTYRSLADLTNLRAWAKQMESDDLAGRQKRIMRTRFT